MGTREQAGRWARRLVLGRENGIRSGVRGWVKRGWDQVRQRGVRLSPFRVHDPRRASAPSPQEEGPVGFLFATRSEEVREGELLEVTVGGEALLLVRDADSLHCVSAVCPHAGGALGDGFVESGQLVCPLHGWGFALEDGECSVSPSAQLPCFDVWEGKGSIWVGGRRSGEDESTGVDDA